MLVLCGCSYAAVTRKEMMQPIPKISKANAETYPQWRPIETAPKDGTQIIGWSAAWGKHTQNVWYLTGLGKWNVTMQPTHWMPLPEPPKTEQEQA